MYYDGGDDNGDDNGDRTDVNPTKGELPSDCLNEDKTMYKHCGPVDPTGNVGGHGNKSNFNCRDCVNCAGCIDCDCCYNCDGLKDKIWYKDNVAPEIWM